MQTSTRGGLVALSLSMLRAGLAMSALVSAVIMATFVVGPFYLSRGLGLEPTWMGLAMAVAPAVAAMAGVPAGYLTDRLGSRHLGPRRGIRPQQPGYHSGYATDHGRRPAHHLRHGSRFGAAGRCDCLGAHLHTGRRGADKY